jgi:chromosome partitioning protein
VASRRAERGPGVQGGIGWPLTSRSRARGRLGWPGSRGTDHGSAALVTSTVVLSEPTQPLPQTVSAAAAAAPVPLLTETPVNDTVALAPREESAVSRETSSTGVSAPAAGVPVSRETTEHLTHLAAEPAADAQPDEEPSRDATPLATAVEYSLRLRDELRAKRPFPRPARTRVMVVANQKGGVGKTTTTVNLAATLADHGLRVLVIDLDPQGNASTALGIEHRRGTPSSYDALVDGAPLADIAQRSTEADGLLVVPATIDLAGAEIELVSVVARENRLRKAIHAFGRVFADDEDRLDYVLIDCPPSLGLLTLNALVAADELLLPIQTEYYALEGVGQLLETVELVRANLNPGLWISTVLLTMYDARTRLSAGVADEVRQHFGKRVLRTAIPRSVRVSEAPSHGRSVMSYDPASPGALSYLEAAREMTEGDAR